MGLTVEGRAYMRAALFAVSQQIKTPICQAEWREFLDDNAPEVSEQDREVIAKALERDSHTPGAFEEFIEEFGR